MATEKKLYRFLTDLAPFSRGDEKTEAEIKAGGCVEGKVLLAANVAELAGAKRKARAKAAFIGTDVATEAVPKGVAKTTD